MKKGLIALSALSGMFLLSNVALATSTTNSSCIDGFELIEKLDIPESVQVRVVEVKKLDKLSGVCAYVLETPSGRQVVIGGEKYIFNGRLYDFDEKAVVQDEILKEYQYINIEDFNELKSLSTLKFGSGNYEAVLVTDPECPYCKRLTQTLSEIEDLSLYVAFMPLSNHPRGIDLSVRIACDQTEKINDFESYFKFIDESKIDSDKKTKVCELYETQQKALKRIMRKNTVSGGVPKMFFKHGVYEIGALPKEVIEKHLEESSPIIPLTGESKVRVSESDEKDDVIIDEGEEVKEDESIFDKNDDISQNQTMNSGFLTDEEKNFLKGEVEKLKVLIAEKKEASKTNASAEKASEDLNKLAEDIESSLKKKVKDKTEELQKLVEDVKNALSEFENEAKTNDFIEKNKDRVKTEILKEKK